MVQLTQLGRAKPGPYPKYVPGLGGLESGSVVTLPPWLCHLALWGSPDMLDHMTSESRRVACSAGFDSYFYLGLGSREFQTSTLSSPDAVLPGFRDLWC